MGLPFMNWALPWEARPILFFYSLNEVLRNAVANQHSQASGYPSAAGRPLSVCGDVSWDHEGMLFLGGEGETLS